MDLVVLVLVVVVIGLLLHTLLNALPPSPWTQVIRVICILILLLFVLSRLGFRLPDVLPAGGR